MGKAAEKTLRTTLSVQQCAQRFEQVGSSLSGGLRGKINSMAAAKRTGSGGEKFYMPSNSSAFSQLDGPPSFEVGINILRGSLLTGAGSKEDSVEMRVYDEGYSRRVELLAAAVGMGGDKSEALLHKFVLAFQ